MTFWSIVLMASVLVVCGVLLGWRLSQWRLTMRASGSFLAKLILRWGRRVSSCR